MAKLYKGFSTKAWVNGAKSLRTSDLECVKDDLHRHIYTVFGERVYMPGFGTEVPIMTFEPDDQITVDNLKDQLSAVFNYDPRVQLDTLNVYALPNEYGLVAIVSITYVEFQVQDTLNLEFR